MEKIPFEQYQNPEKLCDKRKNKGYTEHLLFVDSTAISLDFIKAKSLLDNQRMQMKEKTIKNTKVYIEAGMKSINIENPKNELLEIMQDNLIGI